MHASIPSRLGIAHPVIQAPMAGGWTTPALVAAVANAGGLGNLAGRPTDRPGNAEPDRGDQAPHGSPVRDQLPDPHDSSRRPRRRPGARPAGRGPAQVGNRRADGPDRPFATADEGVTLAIEAGIPIVSFAMGFPAPYVDRLHAAGAFVIGSATTVAEALEVESAGADAVVAQGAEGGGHRSTFVARARCPGRAARHPLPACRGGGNDSRLPPAPARRDGDRYRRHRCASPCPGRA